MSVKLRLRRMGRKKLPVWGLVAADSRSPRDGRFIEDLGRYEPVREPAAVKIDHDRVVYWLLQGAQPSDTVRNLLQREGVLLRAAMTRKGAEAEAIETAVAEFKERQAARDASKTAKPTTAERRQKALDAEREAAKERAAELARQKAELEANLAKQREEAEAAERAEREAALAAASEAGDDAEAPADGEPAVQTDRSDAATGNDAPIEDAAPEAAAEQKVAELEAGDASQADVVADEAETAVAEAEEAASAETEAAETGADGTEVVEAQAAEAEDASTDAAADTTEADVSDEAPDAAEEQPAVQEATTEAVADDTGEAVADQADAGAQGEPEAETAAETTGDAETGGDTLTDLWGVGPKYAGILADAGLTTFADVASKSTEELQAIITDAGSSTAGNEETWARQAQLLADGDTDGHAAYVEELKNA